MKKIILLLLIPILGGCGLRKYTTDYSRIQKSFDLYTGENTSIKELIDIDGYYVTNVSEFASKRQRTVSYDINIIFFEDGMFAYDFIDINARERSDMKSDMNQFFREVIEDASYPFQNHFDIFAPLPIISIKTDKSIAKTFYNRVYWGTYHIQGDTIIAKYAFPKYISDNNDNEYYVRELLFKVVDRNNIVCFIGRPAGLTLAEQEIYDNRENKEYKSLDYRFVKTEIIPPSNSWLKSQYWFWDPQFKGQNPKP